MDQSQFDQMLKMIQSDNDSDALMGLRGLQGLFKHDGVDFAEAISFLVQNMDAMKSKSPTIDNAAPKAPAARPPVTISGMPQCHMPRGGYIEIVPPGATTGLQVQLPGAAGEDAENIAGNFKDALVAAAINKSRFKLKLIDMKNASGEVVETALQAEYERAGMTAVRVWANVRGEVAALATVLRKALATALPDLVAA